MLAKFCKHEEGYVITPTLPLLALASWLASQGGWWLVLLLLLPMVTGMAVAGGTGGELRFERNFARDHHMFRCPVKRKDGVEKITRSHQLDHTKQVIPKAAIWRWEGDNREFLIPAEFVPFLPKMHLVRDVLAVITTLWYEQRPKDRKIYTSLKEIAKRAGIPVNQNNLAEIHRALAFLRAFTIVNQEVITKLTKAGRKAETTMLTYGFISYVAVEHMKDGKILPPNKRRTIICITEPYATLLELLPPANIPITWLEAVKRLPRRLVVAGKNLIYRIAAERKLPARWKHETLVEICDFRSKRFSEQRDAIENLLNGMAMNGILSGWETEVSNGSEILYVLHPNRPKVVTQ